MSLAILGSLIVMVLGASMSLIPGLWWRLNNPQQTTETGHSQYVSLMVSGFVILLVGSVLLVMVTTAGTS